MEKTPSAFINCFLSAKTNKNVITSGNVTPIVCSSPRANIGIYLARENPYDQSNDRSIAKRPVLQLVLLINRMSISVVQTERNFRNALVIATRYTPMLQCSGEQALYNFVRQPRHVNRISYDSTRRCVSALINAHFRKCASQTYRFCLRCQPTVSLTLNNCTPCLWMIEARELMLRQLN